MAENKILTIDEIADWIPPSEAVEILNDIYGNLGLAKATLLERLLGGMVRSISQETAIEGSRPHRTVNVQIPAAHWKDISTLDSVWKTGDLTYKFMDEHSVYRSVAVGRHFNVRFDPKAVQAIIAPLRKRTKAPEPIANPKTHQPHQKSAAAPAVTPETTAKPNKGGRPPKSWWQDFWIEMCCKIYDGSIHLSDTQAAIQEKMHQWVSDHDHDAGETVLKEAAQKLSRALKARSET